MMEFVKSLLVVTLACAICPGSHAGAGAVVEARPCCANGTIFRRTCVNGGAFRLNCSKLFALKEYTLVKDGIVTKDSPEYTWNVEPDEFCVGKQAVNRSGGVDVIDVAMVCYETPSVDQGVSTITIYGVLVIISAAFLLLTLWVHFLIPQLRDLQGKCIMCQSVCLALGFINLAIVQLANDGSNLLTANCAINSFMLYFWFIAMFLWSNVVSVNIFRSISQYRHLKKTESQQFIYYNAYAWGVAFLFLVVALIADNVEGSHHKPNFGGPTNNCWFNSVKSTWIFFYGPVAVLIVINIVMFLLSSRLLWIDSSRHESNVLDALRYKFSLYLKIFIITGVSWIFEVASFAHPDHNLIIWKIMDVFNCLQGIAFFLLLVVFRRRALRGLQELGIGCCGIVPLLLKCFDSDRETEPIVDSEEHNHDQENNVAPFNVNLN